MEKRCDMRPVTVCRILPYFRDKHYTVTLGEKHTRVLYAHIGTTF